MRMLYIKEGSNTLFRGLYHIKRKSHRDTNSINIIPKIPLAIILLFLFIFTMLPFTYLVISSLSDKRELLAGHLIPSHFVINNYVRLFTGDIAGHFLGAMRNSIYVSVATTFFSLIIGVFAAYAFARIKFPFRMTSLFTVLSMQVLPSVSILVPLYIMMRNGVKLNIPFTNITFYTSPPLLDNVWSLIIAYTSYSLPFVVWLLTGYFQTIPKDLEEAAYIDGCSKMGTMFKIVLPLSLPGIAATAIFTLLGAWDEFMFANAFTQTYASKTLPIAIAEFIGRHGMDWGLITAGGVIASLPPVLMSLFLYKYIVSGITTGSLKG